MDILQAEYQVKEAQSYYYPRVNLTAGYTRFSSPLTFDEIVDVSAITGPANEFLQTVGVELPLFIPQEFSVGNLNWYGVIVDLEQPLYTFGRIDEGVKQARIGRSIALNQREKKRAEVIAEVRKGYYQYQFSNKLLQLVKEAEIGAEIVTKMVKIAYETSVPEKEEKGTTRLDYLKARNFQSEVKAKLSETQKNWKLAELGLKMAMGLDMASPLPLEELSVESLPKGAEPSIDLRQHLLAKNHDLKNMELGVQFYDSKRKLAQKEFFPKLGIQGQYIGPEDRWGTRNYWYAGIGLTLPIFDGFLTRAKAGQAEAQFQKVKGQKGVLESALSVKMEYLQTTLNELNERSRILEAAVREARERMQLAADGYSTGITEYEDLLLSQKAELEMKSGYLQTLFHFHMTQCEIEFLLGIR